MYIQYKKYMAHNIHGEFYGICKNNYCEIIYEYGRKEYHKLLTR